MQASEIIKKHAEKQGADPEQFLKVVAYLVQNKQVILLKENDSVLLIKKIGPDEAELHLFTEDLPLTLVKSLKKFLGQLQNSDLKVVYGQADNPEIIGLMKRIGANIQDSDKQQYNWMSVL